MRLETKALAYRNQNGLNRALTTGSFPFLLSDLLNTSSVILSLEPLGASTASAHFHLGYFGYEAFVPHFTGIRLFPVSVPVVGNSMKRQSNQVAL